MGEKKRHIIEFKDIPAQRQASPEIEAEKRIECFEEVELGFTEEVAQREAERCLSCRLCLGCGLCLAECEKKAIDFTKTEENIELLVDTIIIAPGSERFSQIPEERFGYDNLNVITALEFERMLSDTGPYGGLILRPSDGEIPRKIGYILLSESKEMISHPLFYALKEVDLAQKKMKDLEILIFLSEKVMEGKELEETSGRFPAIGFRKEEILEVRELSPTKNLLVRLAGEGEEEMEMVVLVGSFELSPKIRELDKKLGLRLKGYNLWETKDASFPTQVPGISFFGGVLFDD